MGRLSDYTLLHVLWRDGRLTLWNAQRRGSTRGQLLVKRADRAARAALHEEYRRASGLRGEAFLAPAELMDEADCAAIAYEDFAGLPLADAVPDGGLELATGFAVAIQITDGLRLLHARRLLHSRLGPHALLFDRARTLIKFADLGADGRPAAGDAPYRSPEQSAALARGVDVRSDLYALGATLYHVFCGRPPFASHDALELVHSHLARVPPDPCGLRPELPRGLAAVLLKLLAKDPDDRYQSARGVLADLRELASRFNEGRADEPFETGRHDRPDRLRLPRRVYGCDATLAPLAQALGRAAEGKTELVLVSGPSGSGKSTLAGQLSRAVQARNGRFLSGKFEQRGGAVPYLAVRQAFAALLKMLLAEPDAQLERHRADILGVLGDQGRVLLDVMPDLERLIGPQPEVETLGAIEAQFRFARVFRKFVRLFAARGRPLVLFLDDWQWADDASLRLVESLITDPEEQALLLLGAYRDSEVSAEHPVRTLLDKLVSRGVAPTHVTVPALGVDDICALLADTLQGDPAGLRPLAEDLARRTDGNPLYLRTVLHDLAESRVLEVDDDGRWRWDRERLARMAPPANVVSLTATRLTRLPQATRDLLGIAACLGSGFNMATLTCAAGIDEDEVRRHLLPAFDSGVLRVEEKRLSFVHDRVQDAAWSLVEPQRATALQLAIGRRLRAALGPESGGDALVLAVQQLNAGRMHIDDPAERRHLARLNLGAARLARRASAYAAAAGYAAAGMELLGDHAWSSDYATLFDLHELRAECEYLCGNFAVAERLYPQALAHARDDLDRIRILSVQKDQYELQGRYPDAIDVLRRGLALVDIVFPDEPALLGEALREELALMPQNLGGRRIADLVDAPRLDDPLRIATLKLLMGLWPSCYVAGQQDLLALVSVKIANFSLRHGNCEITPAAYVNYSFVAGFLTGDYAAAYEYGKVGIALAERFPDRSVRAWCCFLFGCGTLIWREPLSAGRPYLERAVELGLASGNIACASYAASYIVTDSFLHGMPLDEVRRLYEQHFPFLEQNNPAIHLFGQLGTQGFREMADVEGPDDATLRSAAEPSGFFTSVYLFGRLMGAYVFERDEALRLATEALARAPTLLAGTFKVVEIWFYAALIHARALREPPVDAPVAAALRGRLDELRGRLAALNASCPANVRHKLALVDAEIADLDGDVEAAARGYEEAARVAAVAGFVHDQGLAYELAARFWLKQGLTRLAEASLGDAVATLCRWGAHRRAQWLQRRMPQLSLRQPAPPVAAERSFDVLSLIKAAQAISSEVDLERLPQRLVRVVGENVGARRAVLFLCQDGGLLPAAVADFTADAEAALTDVPVPMTIVQYVVRVGETVLLDDAAAEGPFTHDPVVGARRLRSVLCAPVRHQDAVTAVLYLENDLGSGVFTAPRRDMLELLLGHVAISLANARLFADLRDTSERLGSLFRQTLAGVAQTDLTGRFIQVNARYCEMVGRSASELYGMRMHDLTHPDDLPHNLAQFEALVAHSQPFNIEKRYVRPDGEALWVSNSVSLVRGGQAGPKSIVAVSLDISDRKRAEMALAQQNQRVRLLWETAAVLLTSADPQAMLEGVFACIAEPLGLDAYLCSMTAEPVPRLAGCGGIDAEAAAAAVGELPTRRGLIRDADGGAPAFLARLGLRAGASYPLQVGERTLGTLLFASRRSDAFERGELEFLETVTQYVTVAWERRRLIDQLRDQDRRKDEFLATLSHELRNPLAPIRNSLQLIRFAGNDAAVLESARAMMERQIQQLVRLVDDLLDLSRISHNKLQLRRQPVDLGEVIRNAVDIARPLVDAGRHDLRLVMPGTPLPIEADPVRLAQAISNLLNNAAKFTPPGGQIELLVERSDADLRISVRDNGIGIAPDRLGQVFDMFVQGEQMPERVRSGLGIGLTLVKRLVEMHDGRVQAHSDGPGRGSRFTITLAAPLAREQPRPPTELELPDGVRGAPRAATRRRILVADDNEDAATSLAMMLRFAGHDVRVALDGAAALALAAESAPEVALLDLGMPKADGCEVARRLRAMPGGARTTLIAVTGWGQEEDRLRVRQAGFDAHLVKPVDPGMLQAFIDRLQPERGGPGADVTTAAVPLAGDAVDGRREWTRTTDPHHVKVVL